MKKVNLKEIETFVQDIVVKNVIDLEIDSDFECNIQKQYISSLSFYCLRNALMHLVNNSFAHGFIQGESYLITTSCDFDDGVLSFIKITVVELILTKLGKLYQKGLKPKINRKIR